MDYYSRESGGLPNIRIYNAELTTTRVKVAYFQVTTRVKVIMIRVAFSRKFKS